MSKWLLRISASLSLLLAIAAGLLWIQGYRAFNWIDHVRRSSPPQVRLLGVKNYRNALVLYRVNYDGPEGRMAFGRAGLRGYPRFEPLNLNCSSLTVPSAYPGSLKHWDVAGLAYVHQTEMLDDRFSGGSIIARPPNRVESRFLVIPHWLWLAITMILPAIWLWRGRRARGRIVNPYACRHCGYDLRAHQPGQRCPECGTEIPAGEGSATAG